MGHLSHAPRPFELQKNLAYGKKCKQNSPFSGKNLKNVLRRGHSPWSASPGGKAQWRIYHWAMPPLNCKKVLHMAKNATKMRHFQEKISNFLGRGRPLSHPSAPQAPRLDPLQFFSQFLSLRLTTMLLLTNLGNRIVGYNLVSTTSDLGLLNATRLEVGPVNIQSSH